MDNAAIFLFGSAARGDLDEASDIDVIAIYGSAVLDVRRCDIKAALTQRYGNRVALAEYSQVRIEEMFTQGHLFAWHLFNEAKPLKRNGSATEHAYSFPRPSPYGGWASFDPACHLHQLERKGDRPRRVVPLFFRRQPRTPLELLEAPKPANDLSA
jgi:predicted nucleotidyltransferase